LKKSDSAFIVHAPGIERRHVQTLDGILASERMTPRIPPRDDEALSVMAEVGVASANKALAEAGLAGADIDMVVMSASHHQRPYPAMAIEIQKAIGAAGAAFDMNLGCSSAAAALHVAFNMVRAGAQRRVLVATPELITGHLNFRDRQTHFIFGDASVALVVERLEEGTARPGGFEVLDTRSWTQFSNNIRSNFGYLLRAGQADTSVIDMEGNMIKQVGNRVFKEVIQAASRFIGEFLADNGLSTDAVRRYWLHQANQRMNAMIMKLVLGREADQDKAPTVLDRLGNTAGAGAVIALSENRADMKEGDHGLLCAFGAGYSIGAALLRKT
jgi:beta-ketodecanoyl-[acyl-carrier-protein] synthase